MRLQERYLQVDHYYPFGMRMGGLSSPISGMENRYRYNGKELNTESGLDWYDYGFRWYDPSIAKFGSVDPLAEDFAILSPYQYAGNTPIIARDLDGTEPEWINWYYDVYDFIFFSKPWSLPQFDNKEDAVRYHMEKAERTQIFNQSKSNLIKYINKQNIVVSSLPGGSAIVKIQEKSVGLDQEEGYESESNLATVFWLSVDVVTVGQGSKAKALKPVAETTLKELGQNMSLGL